MRILRILVSIGWIVPGMVAAAEKAGVVHCHVEQDHSPDPMASIKQSISYLGKL